MNTPQEDVCPITLSSCLVLICHWQITASRQTVETLLAQSRVILMHLATLAIILSRWSSIFSMLSPGFVRVPLLHWMVVIASTTNPSIFESAGH